MTLLSPQKSKISVAHMITSTDEDPSVWAIQHKSLLAIRSVKGAIAAYVGEALDMATRRERSGRYKELYTAMSYFSQRSNDTAERARIPKPTNCEHHTTLLHTILSESGILGAQSKDVIAHFSACSGLVNGTLSGTMKKALSEIQARSDRFIQSDFAVVRMLSPNEVPNQVLQYMKDTRFSIFETDLLLHFLDHPNKLVSQSEIQVLHAKDRLHISPLDEAVEQLEAFTRKIVDGPFEIVRQDGEDSSATAWRLRIEPEIHQKLSTNTIRLEELRPWSIATTPLAQLEMPSFSELAKIQIKEKKVPTVNPPDDRERGDGARELAECGSDGVNPVPETDPGSAENKGTVPKSEVKTVEQTIPNSTVKEKKVTKTTFEVSLPAGISEYIVLCAEKLGKLCKTELATDMVCSKFEQLAREKAFKVAHYYRKRVVDRLMGEFKTKWGHLFAVEDATEIFSKPQFQDYTPVSFSAGSPEKLEAFLRRYESGWPLFHPEDGSFAHIGDDYEEFEEYDEPPEEFLHTHSAD